MEVSGRHAPAALPPVKKPARIEYEADWRQSQSGRLPKRLLASAAIPNPDRAARSPVTRPTTIYRLRSYGNTIQKTTILNIRNMCMTFTDLKQRQGCELNLDSIYLIYHIFPSTQHTSLSLPLHVST